MRETKINRRYVLIYTAAFALLCFAAYFEFFRGGKSLIGNGDGQSQYILHLRYMGQWLRQTVSDFLHGDFALRSYDFTIGMGDDVNSVIRFHPMDYLSVFVPAAYTEILYEIIIFLRLYLAGLAFSIFAFYWEKRGWEVLAGAMCYLFCGYAFELGIVHPIYVAPMIVLPLLFLGAEYMMQPDRKHSFVLFSVMVFLGFTSNYYFMYINSVALAVYVLIRFFCSQEDRGIRHLLTLFVRMVSAYAAGLMMSAVTLLPTLSRYLNSFRAKDMSEAGNLLFYEDKRRYFGWFVNLISPLEASGNGTHLNFAVVALPAIVVVLLSARGKFKSMKWMLLSLLAVLLIPFGGYVMAVFHTENNRWVYLISLAAALCVTFAADRFSCLSTLQRRGVLCMTVLFDASVAALTVIYGKNEYHIAAAVQLTVFTVLLAFLWQCKKSGEGASGNRCLALVLSFTMLSCALNGYFTFSPSHGNLIQYYADRGTTQSFISGLDQANYTHVGSKTEEPVWEDVWQDGFYRVDGVWEGTQEDNASLQLRYPGVQIYNSVLNASLVGALLGEENIGLTTMLHIRSLDGRTGAEEIAGVKYFQVSEGQERQLPYGYEEKVWSDGGKAIYENSMPLPFGFTSDTVIGTSDYDHLDAAQREEILLSAAIVDDKAAESLCADGALNRTDGADETAAVFSKSAELPGAADGIKKTENGYRVKKRKASLEVPYQRVEGCDVYVELCGLKPDGFASRLKVKADGISKSITLLSDSDTYTLGREDYLISLGYSEISEGDTLSLSFAKKGKYSFGQIRFYYIPRDGYREKVGALSESALQNVTFRKDRVTGNISLERPKFMVFQIPASKGWTAKVDGEKADLIEADGCYMGLFLPEGEHEVELAYQTPAGAPGFLLTVLGFALLIAFAMLHRRRQKKAAARESKME